MSKWIEELENNAKFSSVKPSGKGDLMSNLPVISYVVRYDTDEITLDGDFTTDELQDLIDHMKKYIK